MASTRAALSTSSSPTAILIGVCRKGGRSLARTSTSVPDSSALKRLHGFFSTSASDIRHPYVIFWYCTSLVFAACYALLGLQEALSSPYVIADDARQHWFWTQRFADPELFPNDFIADYYQSIAPRGYAFLYKVAAAIGIDPLLFNKVLPVILALFAASLSFWICLYLFPFPSAGFMSSVLLAQALSMTDTVFSGTPKAFLYVSFLSFVFLWLRRTGGWFLWAIAFEGLFYPPAVLVSSGVMVLWLLEWKDGRLGICRDRQTWIYVASGLAIGFMVLTPYIFSTDGFGPTVSAEVARTMPEFQPGGRTAFFYDDFSRYWLKGRSGLRLDASLTPATNVASFFWLFLPWFPKQFPLVRKLTPNAGFLPRLLCTSLGLFAAAHLLLFKLYLPSRYSGHYLRIFFTLSAGIALCIVIDALLRHAIALLQNSSVVGIVRSLATQAFAAFFATAVVAYTFFVSGFPHTYFARGTQPELYAYLQTQPKDSLVATLHPESSMIPALARRSTLVGREFAIPYHVGYYEEIRQRAHDTLEAQYSVAPEVLQGFIEQYGVDLWMLDRQSFSSNRLAENRWLKQYRPTFDRAVETLERGEEPILSQLQTTCRTFEHDRLYVLSTDCILAEIAGDAGSSNESNS